jgi:hypothetical protein
MKRVRNALAVHKNAAERGEVFNRGCMSPMSG